MRGILIAAAAIAVGLAGAPAQARPTDCGNQRQAISRLLAEYRGAIERLDARGTERLFEAESAVFENGGVEGTYANYLARHLGPELGHFRSFRFSDHRLHLWCEGNVAVATETYRYRIERVEGAPIERRGVTTSILRRSGRNWQIVNMHGSSRAPRPAS
ncbi:MAG TPA: nuclear transport factor 2 family protein [Allosphingosinicella sp.]|nr:nuclear transport factor 2 family protein [Allosphingosinicella sp.]